MITISTECTFAAYSLDKLELESSIITIGKDTTIICNQDERKDAEGKIMKGDVVFMASREDLVTFLKGKSITNADKTAITAEAK